MTCYMYCNDWVYEVTVYNTLRTESIWQFFKNAAFERMETDIDLSFFQLKTTEQQR